MTRNCPEYTSGVLELFIEEEDEIGEFPEHYLKDLKMRIWYRELSVFDRLRYSLDEQGKEVTMKIRIPEYREVDSHYVCKIDGRFHRVYNAAHLLSKEGFRETELTLIRPENNRMEVI